MLISSSVANEVLVTGITQAVGVIVDPIRMAGEDCEEADLAVLVFPTIRHECETVRVKRLSVIRLPRATLL